jgi:hypothetical protein
MTRYLIRRLRECAKISVGKGLSTVRRVTRREPATDAVGSTRGWEIKGRVSSSSRVESNTEVLVPTPGQLLHGQRFPLAGAGD